MDSFNIIFNQCMKHINKLSQMEDVNEEFLNEVDIFQNNFSQLQQIIDNNGINEEYNKKIQELIEKINLSKNKILLSQNKINSEINKLKTNKITLNYGTKDPRGTYRINRRY